MLFDLFLPSLKIAIQISVIVVAQLLLHRYIQTSVFERLAVRTIRFSNGKFEMKITRSSNKNSVLKQLKRKIYLNQRDRE